MAELQINQSALPRVFSTKSTSGLTDLNQLDHLFAREPEKMGLVVSYLVNKTMRNPLQCITDAVGRMETRTIEDIRYTWDVQGTNKKIVRIVESPSAAVTNAGIGGVPVTVVLDDKWFSEVDVVRTDKGNEVHISGEPVEVENGFRYRLVFADAGRYFDPSEIAVGAGLTRSYSPVTELSDRGGKTEFYGMSKYYNIMTKMRKEHAYSGDAIATKTVIQLPKGDGTFASTWLDWGKWTAMTQFSQEIEHAMLYGQFSEGTLKGPNGKPIIMGAGLRQQISKGNIRYYNKLSYDFLMAYLMDLSYASDTYGGNTKFFALTGKQGMIEFDRAIQEKYKGLGVVFSDAHFVTGQGMNLSFGSQFRSVKFPNNVELVVGECPLYDDININRERHPQTGFPVESYRFTIFNIGDNASGSNFVKIVRKGRENLSLQVDGFVDASGASKTNFSKAASSLDGVKIDMLTEFSVMLKDPLSAGELILSI